MTSTGAFTTEHVDGVLTISFDDGKANTLNTDRLRELHSLIDGAAADGTTAIVIRGRERMFSAGLDVKWLATLDGDGLIELSQVFSSTMLGLLRSPVPTIAEVTGHAIAGGAILAMACDHRIATAGEFRFQMNEVAIGITMPQWMVVITSSAVPEPQRFDLLQLARPFGVGDALAMGTYHQVVAAEDRPAAVAAVAAELSVLDRNAFAGTKSVLWDAASEAALAEIAAS